jgi:hypothetical protein
MKCKKETEGYWTTEAGTGQETAQLLDCFMMTMINLLIFKTRFFLNRVERWR